MPSPAEVAEFQDALDGISTLTIQELVDLWREVSDRGDAIAIRNVLILAVPELLIPFEAMAAELTAVWYDDLAPESKFIARPADTAETEAVEASVRWALTPLFTPSSKTSPLDLMAGMAQRRVFDASRRTVFENGSREGGVMYARYASKTACEFCRMLATRSGSQLYNSAESAVTVGGRGKDVSTNFDANGKRKRGGQAKGVRTRGTQKVGDKFHDHCKCIATPIRPGRSYEPPPYMEEWQQQYNDAVKVASTKGKYGAIDTKAVMAAMREAAK